MNTNEKEEPESGVYEPDHYDILRKEISKKSYRPESFTELPNPITNKKTIDGNS